MSFDKPTRKALARMVGQVRERLATDVTDQLLRLGFQTDGTVLELDRIAGLSEEERTAGRELRQLLEHRIAAESGTEAARRQGGYRRMVREIGFTTFNRLVALRMAEERGLIVQAVGAGFASAGFRIFERVANAALGDRRESYRAFLEGLYDEIALDLPALFDRTSPESFLFPSEQALEELFRLLNDPALAHLWKEDEAIGWVYQYYNDPNERKKMREASSAPRNSRELAVRNQFFTPRYVVEFLTDNTLGRTWYEMRRGETALVEQCRYLVRRPHPIFLQEGEQPPAPFPPGRGLRVHPGMGDMWTRPNPDLRAMEDIWSYALSVNCYDYVEAHSGLEHPHRSDQIADRVCKSVGQVDPLDFVVGVFNRLEHQYHETGKWVGSFEELRCALFITQRAICKWGGVRFGDDGVRALHDAACRQWDLEVEYIPYREPKNPWKIRVLDPACGSGHFLLYAFDLLATIYEEAWLDPILGPKLWQELDAHLQVEAETGGRLADPGSVRLKDHVQARCSRCGATGRQEVYWVVLGDLYQAPWVAGRPLVYCPGCRREMADRIKAAVPLREFDFGRALRRGQFAHSTGTAFLESADLFDCRLDGQPITVFEQLSAAATEENLVLLRRKIPELILRHNLHGIDIDPRACQIAGLALWLRAQRAYQEAGLDPAARPPIRRSNIACAEPMPGDREMLEEYLRGVDLRLRPLVRTVWEKMQLAGEAGSLLNIEEEIAGALAEARQEALVEVPPVQGSLFRQRPPELWQLLLEIPVGADEQAFWQRAEGELLAALRDYAARTANGQAGRRRMFREDAEQGFAFVDLCRKRFDVVLMNPPFGGVSKPSKAYIEAAYPRTKNDLYATFTERALVRLRLDGLLGTITSRTGLFLSSFRRWREEILLKEARPTVVADLGFGVLDAAMVETAAYCLERVEAHR